jgi:Tfp pilus assembly protein PilF
MSNASLRSLLLVAFCIFSFAISVTGQVFIPPGATDTGLGGGNAITGSIVLSTGARLQRRVTVRLQTMTKGDRVTVSDELGNFTFRGLATGEYAIVIDKEKDFEPYRQSVDIRQFRGSPPQIYPLAVRLELKGAKTNPGVINAELAGVPTRAIALYRKALEKSKAGKNQDAIDQLKLAVAEYPKFALAFTELGVQYQRLGKLDEAEKSLRSALELTPDAFTALINYGIVLVRLNRYAEAETQLRLALKQNDQSAVGHYYLGRALAYLGRYDNAEVELNLALAFGGEEMKEAHRYLAAVYSARGKSKRAIAELETYLKLAPTTPDADQLRQMIAKLRNSTQTPKQ